METLMLAKRNTIMLMLPSTCTLNRVETKNMRIYK